MNLFNFFSHNWIAIIFFNFKMLPLRQAIKLPFDFYGSIKFHSLKGKIKIKSSKIKRGIIKIGGRGSEMFPRTETIIDINGIFEVGDNVEIGRGVSLTIKSRAKCILSSKVIIGPYTKIYCEEEIRFGEGSRLSWESQVFDTNFHYIENIKDNIIYPKTNPIIIGKYNWLGNRVTIMKGTKLGDNMIVASNSLINKDYLSIPEYSILGGCPAKVVKENMRRLFPDEEKKYIKNLQ